MCDLGGYSIGTSKANKEGKLMRPIYEYDFEDGLDDVADRDMEDEL